MLKNVVIAGAGGLVGRSCLDQLLADPRIGRVLSLGRRSIGLRHERLGERVVDFARLEPGTEHWDAAVCALGTTRKKAGSDAAFRLVDLDYVREFAQWAHDCGAEAFVLVSSVGADAASGNLYLRTKGEAEAAVVAFGFPSVTLLQPSFLLGARAESRLGERLGIGVATVLAPLLIGGLARYRPIASVSVAAALLAAAVTAPVGVRRLEYAGILAEGGSR